MVWDDTDMRELSSCTVAWAIETTICEAADTQILRHSQMMVSLSHTHNSTLSTQF